MPDPLPTDCFTSRDTVALARSLIGKRLCRKDANGKVDRMTIVETEAYDGPEDLACHASRGRTKRTEVMFGPAGHWYVYLVYGMHQMLNLVTGPEGYPAAILIRGVDGISGPGRLTKRLAIDPGFNTKPATIATRLWITDTDTPVDETLIRSTPRIGIDYAGPDWAQRPYRFLLDLS